MRVSSIFTFLFAAIATETVGAQGIFCGRNNGNRVRALIEEVSMSADFSLSLPFGGIGINSDPGSAPEPSGKSGKGSSMMSMGKSGKGGSMMSMGKSGKGSSMMSMGKSGKGGKSVVPGPTCVQLGDTCNSVEDCCEDPLGYESKTNSGTRHQFWDQRACNRNFLTPRLIWMLKNAHIKVLGLSSMLIYFSRPSND